MPNLIPFFQKHFPRFFPQIQKTTPLYDRVKSLRPVSVRPDTLTPSLGLAYFLEANVSIFADIVLTLKQEVTRRGMVWKPRFAVKCMDCGSEYIEEKPVCDCGSANLKQPDRTQIQRFRNADGNSFLESANLNRQTLESVVEEATRHGTIGDRIYLLCIKNYLQDEVGNILASYPVEFISIDPRDIEPIEQDDGTPGGKYWICLDHRDDVKEKPGVCRQCGKVLYEVLYQTTGLGQKQQYYIDGEIYFTPVHYPRKGYPPILKMLYDAYAYHYMEMRTYNYQKKGRPPGFLVFPTNNLESLKAQWEALLTKAQEDPDSPQAMGFDPGQGKAAAQFITLMKDPGPDMLEVKKDLRERMGSMFGVSLIFQGDTSASGGLNNEGLQITVTNRATEFYQKPLNGREQNNYKDGILYWIVSQFGVTDFVLQLLPSEEQDEMAEKLRFGLDADNAKKMLDMGYDVKFENGKFTFSGQAQKPQPPGFGGEGVPGMPGLPGMPGVPAPPPAPGRVSGTPADVGKAGDIKKESGWEGRPGECKLKGHHDAPASISVSLGKHPKMKDAIAFSKNTGKEYGMAINRTAEGKLEFGEVFEGKEHSVVIKPGNTGSFHTHPGENILNGPSRQDFQRMLRGEEEMFAIQNTGINDKGWIAMKTKETPNLKGKKTVDFLIRGNGIKGKDAEEYTTKYMKPLLKDLEKNKIKLYYGDLGGEMKQITAWDDYVREVKT